MTSMARTQQEDALSILQGAAQLLAHHAVLDVPFTPYSCSVLAETLCRVHWAIAHDPGRGAGQS
jgi:hypothetical protein